MPGEQKGKTHTPGTGRPRPAASPTVRVTVTLLADQVVQLKDLGRGSVSAGIRRLLSARQIVF